MRLVSLELQGFKSFADRLKLDFHSGITGIVGPNGSGKSNISDAIRWVLGEQSAKTLRGGKMEDVIFSGTAMRRALSYAEVILTLDNSDGSINTPFETIEVRRRLYRSGESEYLLNKKKCRLRDIAELFMDSGLARDGYSIVGQGRVDEILSHRSEDRREIFDEAGGITKYRARRSEALRKLETVEQNILRIEDIRLEIERRRKPLSKQAEAAQRYLDLDREFRSLDLARLTHEAKRLKEEQSELTMVLENARAELSKKTRERDAFLLQNEEAEAKLQTLRNRAKEKELEYREADDALRAIQRQADRMEQEEAEAKRFLTDRERRVEEDITLAKRFDQEIEVLEKEVLAKTQDHSKAHGLTVKSREAYSKGQANLNEEQGKLSAIEQELQAERLRRLDYQIEAQDRSSKLHLSKNLAEQEERLLERAEEILGEREEELRKSQGDIERVLKKKQEAEEQLVAYKTAYETSAQALEMARNKLREARESEDVLQRRIRNLEHMIEGHEGYQNSVRRLMKDLPQIHRVAASDVLGPFGSLITVSKELQPAIDQALGAAIQNLVVTDEQVANVLIKYLRQQGIGRAVFLPLAQLRANPLRTSDIRDLRGPGFLGIASELVEYIDLAKPAIDYRLGRTLVARTLDDALDLHRQSHRRFQWVTLDGDSIYPGGAISGGQAQRRSQGLGILERQGDLQAALLERDMLVHTIEQFTHEFELIKTEERRSSKQLLELEEVLEQCLQDERVLRESVKHIEGSLRDAQKERDHHAKALIDVRQSIEAEEANLAHSNSAKPDEAREEVLQSRREELASFVQDLQIEVEALRERRHAAEVDEHRLHEALQADKRLLERYLEDRRTRAARQALESAEADNYRLHLVKLQEEAKTIQSKLRELQGQSDIKQEERDEAQTLVAEAESSMQGFLKKLTVIGEERELLQREQLRLDHRLERLLSRLDDALNQLWENYEVTYDDHPKVTVPYEGRSSDKRLTELRKEMKNLGQVNLQAIEEFTELEERFQFIETQKEDMVEARQDLDVLVSEINQAMEEKFRESFDAIRTNFSETFRELFGGGEAEVRLANEEDLLESEIEIRVSPPGKRMQNLLLLSGGERTLAAIALLFSIQRLKPTAFCLLDEVEAALDESNIFRFTDYIRRYSHETQYILVTHRKATMEVCDRLYGVTMQEHGISKVLSLKLQDV